MANSLLELLLQTPSSAEKFAAILPLLEGAKGSPGMPGSPGVGQEGISGSTVAPNGDTEFPYQTFPRPYGDPTGPSNMVTRQGVTLQRGPMRSLVEIARNSNLLPGIQEIGEIGQGYRPLSSQQAMQSNPYAADPGMSYHQQGLAIDAGWWSDRAKLNRALGLAGWNQFDRSYEPWHYSYGVTG
jgi:hypothetical protein